MRFVTVEPCPYSDCIVLGLEGGQRIDCPECGREVGTYKTKETGIVQLTRHHRATAHDSAKETGQ